MPSRQPPSPTRDALLWSRLLAGRLAWQMGRIRVRVLRVRFNQHARHADRTRPHRHPFHQILYFSQGQGTEQLEDQACPVKGGAICFIRSGLLHSFSGSGKRPATCLTIDLEMDGADATTPERPGAAAAFTDEWILRNAFGAGERRIFHLSSRFQAQVNGCMARIDRETAARQPGYVTAVQGLLLELLALFLRATRQTAGFAQGTAGSFFPGQTVLARAIALADMDMDPESDEGAEVPSLALAARQAGVSPNHLNHLLRQQTGLTFRQTLIQRRIARAKALLQLGDLNCTEVAMACGFSDSNYFARLFRQKTGVTPTRFRGRRRRQTS